MTYDDLICFSHLRWSFVFQRPQHLLSRCARSRRVFYIEEPLFDSEIPTLQSHRDRSGVVVLVPHLPAELSDEQAASGVKSLLDRYLATHRIANYILWYYTPVALEFSRHLQPRAIVYDCMDELSAFAGAPPGLRDAERELLSCADLVLTGGASLYESKRLLHPNVHAFPSSVDVPHFAQARLQMREPDDQVPISRPRLGYFGVVDERFDLPLLSDIAAERPDWQYVIIGPVVKIDPGTLPRSSNIHYLGQKTYDELPRYIAGWDVALMPFARNEATRFISPTKTPEYLAAGRPVVSTSIRDVVRPYGQNDLVSIADAPGDFIAAIEASLHGDHQARQSAADSFLSGTSWDQTWTRINHLLETVRQVPRAARVPDTRAAARAETRPSAG